MSNDLVPFSVDALPTTDLAVYEDVENLTKSNNFLSRIQLVTKGKYVDAGKIAPGHYAVPQPGGEDIVDLGDTIDILPLCVRSKALDMSDTDNVVAVYDRNSAEFKDIEARSEIANSNCMCGPSFLVFERNTATFYEYFMGTKSALAESGKLVPFCPLGKAAADARGVEPHGPLPATLTTRYVKRKTYGWHVPVVNKCSEPFTNLPPLEIVRNEVEKFINVKDDGVQNVTEETKKTRRAR